MKRISVFLILALTVLSGLNAQKNDTKSILIRIESISDIENSFDNKPRFNVNYSVENLGYGTLYAMKFDIKVYDDRDNEMDVVFDQMDPFEYEISFTSSSNYSVLAIGEKMKKAITITGNKKYISKIVIIGLDNHDFSMRMFPENINPLSIIKTGSNISNVQLLIDSHIKKY